MPKVSIVMPVYNQQKFVADSIISCLKQTVADFELVIVDDGSTDGSYEICETYAKIDSRIRLNRRSHQGGQAVATNEGCIISTGEYLAWHHSDDNYHPQFLEWALEAAEAGAEVVYGQFYFISVRDEIGAGPFPKEAIWDYKKFQEECYLCCGAMLFTREAYDAVGGYDETFHTSVDWDFGLRVCRGREVVVLDKTFFYYRKHHPWSNRSRLSESVRNRDRKRIRTNKYA